MWNIVSINTAVAQILVSSLGVFWQGGHWPNGPLAGDYVLAFPGMGFITLKDKGNTGI